MHQKSLVVGALLGSFACLVLLKDKAWHFKPLKEWSLINPLPKTRAQFFFASKWPWVNICFGRKAIIESRDTTGRGRHNKSGEGWETRSCHLPLHTPWLLPLEDPEIHGSSAKIRGDFVFGGMMGCKSRKTVASRFSTQQMDGYSGFLFVGYPSCFSYCCSNCFTSLSFLGSPWKEVWSTTGWYNIHEPLSWRARMVKHHARKNYTPNRTLKDQTIQIQC